MASSSSFEALRILLLAASMLVMTAGSTDLAEPPPSGYRSELVHVDAKGGFTKHELIRRAVRRSKLRAEALSSLASDAAALSSTMKFSSADSEYHMKLSIGGSPVPVIADTGSDLSWVPKKHCGTCLAHPRLMYGECGDLMDKLCAGTSMKKRCGECPSSVPSGGCCYGREYGEGSEATGYIAKGKVTVGHDGLEIGCAASAAAGLSGTGGELYIGCTTTFHCAPKTPAKDCHSYKNSGVAGLGRGRLSIVTNLGSGRFSYCLTDYLKPDLNSPITFGRLASPPKEAKTANLVVPSSSKYFVKMTKMSMRGEDRNMLGDGGVMMFIDSGMSFTHLPEEAFRAVETEVDQLITGKSFSRKPKDETENKPFTCYKGTELPHNMPEMVLDLDGAEMHLPVENYILVDKPHKEVCLAMMQQPGKDKTAILGNFQQQNLLMHFDITRKPGKLSFARVDDCSKELK
ncbi:hypothetical protein ACP70R_003946 [Stipagrostis hirtigluma subsp. patula]